MAEKLLKKIFALGFSCIFSICIFTGLIYLTWPEVKIQELPKPHILSPAPVLPFEVLPSPFMGTVALGGGPSGFPTPPGVPAMPGASGAATHIEILGVLPPKVAIISVGDRTLTVEIGEKVGNKEVSEVTEEGVVIGGKFYPLKNGGVNNATT